MTSALVAAGTLAIADDAWAQKAANPVQLTVGGYLEQAIGFSFGRRDSVQQTGLAGNTPGSYGAPNGTFDQQTESEVHFIGNGRLDNGLVIRAVIEFEVTGSPGNLIDEQFLILRNGFGQVILGNEDSAASLMTTGYATVLPVSAGHTIIFDTTDFISAPAAFSPGGSPLLGSIRDSRIDSFDNDSSKITYITPRFFGFQFGASYSPEAQQQLNIHSNTSATGVTTGQDTGNRPPIKTVWSDGFFGAVNFETKFDQVGIGLAAGYQTASNAGTSQVLKTTKDPETFIFGGRINFGGITAIAGYKKTLHLRAGDGIVGGAPGSVSKNGDTISGGAIYRAGPNWFSFTATKGSDMGTLAVPGDDEQFTAIASYRRILAPGVSWRANVVYVDFDNEPAPAATPLSQPDYDEWAITTSFRLDW